MKKIILLYFVYDSLIKGHSQEKREERKGNQSMHKAARTVEHWGKSIFGYFGFSIANN
jgi:hypothetical protein